MPKKVASALGLVGFAVMAVLGVIKPADFGATLARAIVAAVVMCLVGYVAGSIAQKALEEAVDNRMPLQPEPKIESPQAAPATKGEDDK